MIDGRDWMELEATFYEFYAVASRLGFYQDDIRKMEKSLWEMSPFPRKEIR